MQKIWTFKDNDSVETEGIDLKTFKPVGKFFDDVETLCKMFNIKQHPALKPPAHNEGKQGESHFDEEKAKDVNTLTFYKHRLDKNSMRVMFLALSISPNIHTLK